MFLDKILDRIVLSYFYFYNDCESLLDLVIIFLTVVPFLILAGIEEAKKEEEMKLKKRERIRIKIKEVV